MVVLHQKTHLFDNALILMAYVCISHRENLLTDQVYSFETKVRLHSIEPVRLQQNSIEHVLTNQI